MKFDKRNPFAAWGHEQEIYTVSGENETVEINQESKGFINAADLSDNELFVTNPESDVKVVSPDDFTETVDVAYEFRANNENKLPADMFKKRVVPGQDNEYKQSEDYNNTELNYYGIQGADLELYGEEETEGGGEGAGEEGGEGGNTEGGNTEGGNTEGGNTEGGNTTEPTTEPTENPVTEP